MEDLERDPEEEAEEQASPAERPQGVTSWGTTAAEQRTGEPLGERLAHEAPDRPAGLVEDGVRLADDGDRDETDELTSTAASEDPPGPTAEESAVHTRNHAPGGTSAPDSYVDTEAEGRRDRATKARESR